jgi:serine/threonine protein kinase
MGLQEKEMNWAVVLKLAMDMAQGMRFMHNFQPALIHRDLKSPNVLVRLRHPSPGHLCPVFTTVLVSFGYGACGH